MKISIYISDEEKDEKCCSKEEMRTDFSKFKSKQIEFSDDNSYKLIKNLSELSSEELLEIKKRYVKIIAEELGLPADATVNRITVSVMLLVDEFLRKMQLCGTIRAAIKTAFKILELNINVFNAIDIVHEAFNTLKTFKNDYKDDVCYAVYKRNYAQEIQYLFFIEGGASIEWKNKTEQL